MIQLIKEVDTFLCSSKLRNERFTNNKKYELTTTDKNANYIQIILKIQSQLQF